MDSRIDAAIDRRRLLKVGGLSAVGAVGAVALAACEVGPGGTEEGVVATTTTTEPSRSDISILQTATTLEALAVEVYGQALSAGILVTPAVVEAFELLVSHHNEHRQLFAGETNKLDAETATGTNATLRDRLAGRIAAGNEGDAVRLALDIERALAATYQANTAAVDAAPLRTKIMSVGGVEARHVTLLSAGTREPLYPATGIQTAELAVPPGTPTQ